MFIYLVVIFYDHISSYLMDPIKVNHYLFSYIYLLTYLLTPWSRVLLEKLTGFQLVKKFPSFYGTPKVHSRIHQSPPRLPILNQIDSVHTTTSHFLKIHLNIIFPSTSGSSMWPLSLRFSPPKLCIDFSFSHTSYMPRPSHSSRFDHPNNIW